jgi:hypothetical protein
VAPVVVESPAEDTRFGPTREESLLVDVGAAFAAERVAPDPFAAGIIVVSDFVVGVARPIVDPPERPGWVRGAEVLVPGLFGLGGAVLAGCGVTDDLRSWASRG